MSSLEQVRIFPLCSILFLCAAFLHCLSSGCKEYFLKDKPVSSTSANVLSCKIVLLSPTLFVWLAHTSPGRFTVQLRVPDCAYIPKNDLNFKLNTKHSIPTDLRTGTAKLVVIRLGNRGGQIFCKVWHNCNHFRAHSFS